MCEVIGGIILMVLLICVGYSDGYKAGCRTTKKKFKVKK